MTAIIRFYKISFLIGAHAAAFAALTFGALAGITILPPYSMVAKPFIPGVHVDRTRHP
jgi:hypothetical protein